MVISSGVNLLWSSFPFYRGRGLTVNNGDKSVTVIAPHIITTFNNNQNANSRAQCENPQEIAIIHH